MSVKKTETIILRDSPEAASLRTVTGWVSSRGHFFGDDERTARYDGATHQRCANDAEHPIYAINGYCHACYKHGRQLIFKALPRAEWKGEPLVIFDTETYFFDEQSLTDYCVDEGCNPQDLQLVICEPNYAGELDPGDYCSDLLPDEGDVPDGLAVAVDAFNAIIRRLEPLSWSQGNTAAIIVGIDSETLQ